LYDPLCKRREREQHGRHHGAAEHRTGEYVVRVVDPHEDP